MRISKVSLYHKKLPMICGKFSCSLEPGVADADVVITEIETDEGLVGYGESGAVGGYPNYARGILSSSAELIQRHLMDKNPLHLNPIQEIMSLIDGHGAIKSGFDIACWDILGQALGKPLYEVLGGKLQDAVPLYRSIATEAPADMARAVEGWRLEGYKKFQLRVGHGNLQDDIDRIQAVIAQQRPGEMYTVDVAGQWRMDEALYVLKALKDLDFTIEQPCWTHEECLALRQRIDFPMKLDNSLNNVEQVLRAYADNAFDSMVLQLNKFGGISPARQVRDIITAIAVPITYSTQWGTEITTAALTHLSMTTPANRFLSTIDIHHYSAVSLASNNPIIAENGMMTMANADPGLGVKVNREVLGKPDIVLSNH